MCFRTAMLASVLSVICLPASQAQQRPWYAELSIGRGLATTLSQTGHNLDYLCYPGRTTCLPHEGFRWYYDLPADQGWAISATLGRALGRLRIEVSALQEVRDVESRFTGLTFLDGRMRPDSDPGSGVIETVNTSIGAFRIRSLRLNALYGLFSARRRAMPYVGAGVGVSGLAVTDSFFESRFSCEPTAGCFPNIDLFDSSEHTDFTDLSVSFFGYVGADFPISERLAAGLRLALSQSGKLNSESTYTEHPLPDLTSSTEVSNIQLASVLASIRYSFGSVR